MVPTEAAGDKPAPVPAPAPEPELMQWHWTAEDRAWVMSRMEVDDGDELTTVVQAQRMIQLYHQRLMDVRPCCSQRSQVGHSGAAKKHATEHLKTLCTRLHLTAPNTRKNSHTLFRFLVCLFMHVPDLTTGVAELCRAIRQVVQVVPAKARTESPLARRDRVLKSIFGKNITSVAKKAADDLKELVSGGSA